MWNELIEYDLREVEDLSLQCKLSVVDSAEDTDIGSETLKVSLLFNEGKGINDIFYIFDPLTKKASGKVHLHVTFTPDPNPPPVAK